MPLNLLDKPVNAIRMFCGHFGCKILIVEPLNVGLQIIEQLVPFLIILLGLVLLFVAIWGIVLYRRQTSVDGEKVQKKEIQ